MGKPFTDGLESLRLNDAADIRILDIQLTGVSDEDGLTLVGALVAANDREDSNGFQKLGGFPPRQRKSFGVVQEAKGALLPAEAFTEGRPELLLGILITKPGRFTREGIVMFYESGGTKYRADFVAELTVCTPEFQTTAGQCPLD